MRMTVNHKTPVANDATGGKNVFIQKKTERIDA